MDRRYYLDMADAGLRMPIGADLLLHEHEDCQVILVDGERLGRVIEETARRFGTPLAIPRMDLELEKSWLLTAVGVSGEDAQRFHFNRPPTPEQRRTIDEELRAAAPPRVQAQVEAIRYIAESTELLPIGMSIGPFSLMTKLIADPITPVCLAGMGIDDDPDVLLVGDVIEIGLEVIESNIMRQIEAGARAIFVAEPAANKIYFSPRQIESGSDIFDRFVTGPNRRVKSLLESRGVDLIFHCCGELTDYMVSKFTTLDPAILSLGSSRKLWEDAALVPKTTVLFGNLPSKQFYSDDLIPQQEVARQGEELIERMREAGHPFILGSECDVLSVPGCQETLMRKAESIAGQVCGCATAVG